MIGFSFKLSQIIWKIFTFIRRVKRQSKIAIHLLKVKVRGYISLDLVLEFLTKKKINSLYNKLCPNGFIILPLWYMITA